MNDLAFGPLERTSDIYYRANGQVFGPMQVDMAADQIRVFTTDGRTLLHPRTTAGLGAAVLDAQRHARIGEGYAGAIDWLLRKPRVARHGRGSLVR